MRKTFFSGKRPGALIRISGKRPRNNCLKKVFFGKSPFRWEPLFSLLSRLSFSLCLSPVCLFGWLSVCRSVSLSVCLSDSDSPFFSGSVTLSVSLAFVLARLQGWGGGGVRSSTQLVADNQRTKKTPCLSVRLSARLGSSLCQFFGAHLFFRLGFRNSMFWEFFGPGGRFGSSCLIGMTACGWPEPSGVLPYCFCLVIEAFGYFWGASLSVRTGRRGW